MCSSSLLSLLDLRWRPLAPFGGSCASADRLGRSFTSPRPRLDMLRYIYIYPRTLHACGYSLILYMFVLVLLPSPNQDYSLISFSPLLTLCWQTSSYRFIKFQYLGLLLELHAARSTAMKGPRLHRMMTTDPCNVLRSDIREMGSQVLQKELFVRCKAS